MRRSNIRGSSSVLKCPSIQRSSDVARDSDDSCSATGCDSNVDQEINQPPKPVAKPTNYSLTVGDHCALLFSSSLLMVSRIAFQSSKSLTQSHRFLQLSLYFYFFVDLYGTGDWYFHMTERPPTPQAVIPWAVVTSVSSALISCCRLMKSCFWWLWNTR